jgi:glyoxylase-like metal-dependent hydrolase (beta-lactamase superfamily II)
VNSLPFEDRGDFEDADRGLIGSLDPGVVKDASGRVVWDNDAFAFLREDCPETANPSLWRQSQLCARQGLFEVTEGIYQVRGLDLSNMTIVEGDRGVIVIDPLISTETAAAALALYRQHRGDRPVTGVIYTHSHGDHFGGVRGVVTGEVPILAPAGFLEHAVEENVYAGGAMNRRAVYMYGAELAKTPEGQIGAGLGMTTSTGTVSLIPPTADITRTGQQETVDGVLIEFQLTPGTEAPAEMNFLFPDRRALCMAENATHNLHNLLTLRGALVRDPRIWARYLHEAIVLFGDRADVAFASHHWPTWGHDKVIRFLSEQRDLYAYLGANSLIITVFGEEEQPGDGCEHALELVDRAAVAAAFPAEHPPCLHPSHGVLDGGADLAEDGVEFTLPVQEFRSAEALEWHDPDAVDSDVAEVGASIACGHGFLKSFLEAGGLERVGIVPCAVHGNRADGGHVALEIARDLHVHSRVICLPGIQVRDCVPVPHRADGAVYQGSSLAAEYLDGIGDIRGENLADCPAQQVPPSADRRLAAMEMRCCGSLGCIAAHQHDDHDHRVEQSDRRRLFRAGLDQRADLLHDQEAQLVQLPGGQPCESIVLQRFLLVIL